MKRCLFYFKSLFLSLTLLFFFSSFARAETTGISGLKVHADVRYTDLEGSSDLELTFQPDDASYGLPHKVQVNANVFRDGYFGILYASSNWSTLATKTGCASGVKTELTDSFTRTSDNNEMGVVKLTLDSVSHLRVRGSREQFIRISATVDLTFQAMSDVAYSDITFIPTDFYACISPSGGFEAPVPPRIGERTDGPTAGDDCGGFMTVEEALRCRHGDLATPPAGGDSTTPPTTPGTTGPDTTDTSNDSFGPPASVPTSPVSGGRSFFQGGGCSLGAGLPNSASSLAWVLFGLFGGMGLFRIRQLKKN